MRATIFITGLCIAFAISDGTFVSKELPTVYIIFGTVLMIFDTVEFLIKIRKLK